MTYDVKKKIAGYPAAHKDHYYRCFLPDLAGFVRLCCAGPGYQTEMQGRQKSPIFFMAERVGFEPTVPVSQNTRFPVVHLRPLGHLSYLVFFSNQADSN